MSGAQKVNLPRAIIQALLFVVLMPLLPLLISRRWDWWWAWAYFLTSFLGFAISRVLAARRNPDLIRERARAMQHEDAKSFDKKLLPVLFFGGIIVPLIAGLDELFGWSPAFSLPLKIAALLLMLGGYAFSSWALIENRFFSDAVRIQADRGHEVVSKGPYAWVRHPGYAGGLLSYLMTPLLLDSAWAFIPTAALMAATILRAILEDRMLQAELPGYREYAQRVRYRLLPGVW